MSKKKDPKQPPRLSAEIPNLVRAWVAADAEYERLQKEYTAAGNRLSDAKTAMLKHPDLHAGPQGRVSLAVDGVLYLIEARLGNVYRVPISDFAEPEDDKDVSHEVQ